MTFEPFPKLARLSRECTITEKIDGTNAQVLIKAHYYEPEKCMRTDPIATVGDMDIFAGSRTRLIWPGKLTDNAGFAAWVLEHAEQLVELGPGRHFGEWWGKGIQRNYGLTEKRFSLFNTHGIAHKPDCVSVVPVLAQGNFYDDDCDWDARRVNDPVRDALGLLTSQGSQAAPGFMKPEGIVIWHVAARVAFKKTFEKDAQGKGE